MLSSNMSFLMLNYTHYYYPFYTQPYYYSFGYIDHFFTHQQVQKQLISIPTISEQETDFKFTLTKQDLQQQGIGISKRHWSEQQDILLKKYAIQYDQKWNQIAKRLTGRNQKMCYSRYRRILNDNKNQWTQKENQNIKRMFQIEEKSWKTISKLFPNRTAKQIRQHYLNFLRPNIKKAEWTLYEDMNIIQLYNQHGKKWKMFQQYFQGRTENQIKNRFYGRLKRLQKQKQISVKQQ